MNEMKDFDEDARFDHPDAVPFSDGAPLIGYVTLTEDPEAPIVGAEIVADARGISVSYFDVDGNTVVRTTVPLASGYSRQVARAIAARVEVQL